ncbi:MAG: CpsB/CapC family capsule biosynthesis tyrosine phosphatase [Acutalibacteraceae bacterium]|nr:CpsB/CapC family capsule biosynthesis tyrosine phosphatase [Acutalibacteraceae bacterium]
MTDLHSHIIYGVDDGSENMDMSIEMLRGASKAGTRNIVFTPHCNISVDEDVRYKNDILINRYKQIKSKSKQIGLDINIYLGSEVYASNDITELIKRGNAITLNHSRYLLTEFNFNEDPLFVSNTLGKIQSMGLVPLLAHPERYKFVQKFPYMVYDWVRSGCLIQINRGSLIGGFGEASEQLAHFLLEENLVHIVSSDGHRPYRRKPVLNDAYNVVDKYYGRERAERLFKKNPEMILHNKEIRY